MRGQRERLQDILDAILLIEQFVTAGRDDFMHNQMVQSAVVYQLQIIGEASAHLSSALKQQNPDVLWKEISEMRNRLVHAYFGVRKRRVWRIITEEIPEFKLRVIDLINASGD